MKRKALPLFAVVLMMLLAGCSYASEGVEPEVVEVSHSEGDTYRMTVNMTSEYDSTFHDVRLYGYTLTGERVCSMGYGNVTDATKTRAMTCSGFPSLLVPDAEELSMSDFEDDPPKGGVSHVVKLYRGHNETHQFESFATRQAGGGQRSIGRSLPPDEEVLSAGRCTQWAKGDNMSAVGDRPWLDWDRHPPNVSTSHSLTVRNGTESRDEYGYTAAGVSARTAERLETVSTTNDSRRTFALNESEFLAEVAVLAGTNVSNRSAVGDVGGRIDGEVDQYDYTRIECWTKTPEHDGETGYEIEVYVRYGDEVWALELTVEEEYGGPARQRDAAETPTPTNGSASTG